LSGTCRIERHLRLGQNNVIAMAELYSVSGGKVSKRLAGVAGSFIVSTRYRGI